MEKQVVDVFIKLSGSTLKEFSRGLVGYRLQSVEDPLMQRSVSLELWKDDEIQKLAQALWERCGEYIVKTSE